MGRDLDCYPTKVAPTRQAVTGSGSAKYKAASRVSWTTSKPDGATVAKSSTSGGASAGAASGSKRVQKSWPLAISAETVTCPSSPLPPEARPATGCRAPSLPPPTPTSTARPRR